MRLEAARNCPLAGARMSLRSESRLSVPLKSKQHFGATLRSDSAGSPTSQVCRMISDDGNAERDAREPSSDVRDLDLRVVIEEGNESEETDQACEYQRSENLQAAITVSCEHRFHGSEHYPRIAHLTCAEGHDGRAGALLSRTRQGSA